MPGSPSSSWAVYRARLTSIFRNADASVVIAFWLFGMQLIDLEDMSLSIKEIKKLTYVYFARPNQ